jgi:histidinol-phosphate aminotransferase
MYNSKLKYIVEYKIPSIKNYILHDLCLNENHYPHSKEVLKTLNNFTVDDITLYHRHNNNHQVLDDALQNYLNIKNQDINMLLTNGSDGALELILKTFCSENDLVSIVIPTYPHFEQRVDIACNSEKIQFDYLNSSLIDYEYNGKLIYISYPNMPYGYGYYDQILQLSQKYEKKLIIVDEAYIELSEYKSFVNQIQHHKNIIVTRSFSKGFGLAGIRLGYCAFNNIHKRMLCKAYSIKNITSIAVKLATAALNSLPHYQANWDVIKNEYHRISDELTKIVNINKAIFHYELGSAPFFLVYVYNPKDLCNFFESHAISIRDKSSEINFAVRISISRPDINNKVLDLLKQYNNEKVTKNNYIDLDNTLRNGSSHNSHLFKSAINVLNKTSARIITNNVDYTKEELVRQTGLEDYILITPIESIKKVIEDEKHIPYIIGEKNIKEFLGHRDLDISEYTIFVVCGDLFEGDINTIAKHKVILNRLNKIYVFEFFNSNHISKCSNKPIKLDVHVPYFGKYLELIEFKGEIINFGKNSCEDPHFGLMIGDTLETDGEVCFKNNGLFVHVLCDNSPLKWNGKYFTVGNVDILDEHIN